MKKNGKEALSGRRDERGEKYSPPAIKNFLLVYPPDNSQAKKLSQAIFRYITRTLSMNCFFQGERQAQDINCVITVGGDGSFLYGAHLASALQVPVLGINLGYLGYLTEVAKDDYKNALAAIVKGSYTVENRSGIQVMISKTATKNKEFIAINEAAIERVKPGQTVKLELRINCKQISSFSSDGVIVATPTGSTAYNLSVGGPVVEPSLAAMIVTPISAHSLINRSFVLGRNSELSLILEGNRGAELVIDGQANFPIESGMEIKVKICQDVLQIIHVNNYDFWSVLKEKFQLGNA